MASKSTNPDNRSNVDTTRDANPDAITGAPGSHPVGTGVGAAGAGTIGAVIGAAGGPIGAAAGAAIGAVVGGLVGKGVAEGVNPTAEDAYWRDNYQTRPYVSPGSEYDDLQPAYRYGWEARGQYQGKDFQDVEADLSRDWYARRGNSDLTWDQAKLACRDAWDHVVCDNSSPSDRDNSRSA